MNLKNNFIVAMPTLNDPFFNHSVVYICEHSSHGSMGVMINKPIFGLTVSTILSRLDITTYKNCAELEQAVFVGGPLAEEQGFILHTPQKGFSSSIQVSDEIMITTSLDLLRAVGSPEQPDNLFFALGYAGWQHMQLEKEIAHNDWLVTNADPNIIFATAVEDRWQKAAESLGININTISPQMGNA